MKVIAFLIEVFSWLKIIASPVIISLIFAVFIYYYFQSELGIYIASTVVVMGLVVGVVVANTIWKKPGKTTFMARLYSHSELEKKSADTKSGS